MVSKYAMLYRSDAKPKRAKDTTWEIYRSAIETCVSCGIVVEKGKQARCKNVYANALVQKKKPKTPSLESAIIVRTRQESECTKQRMCTRLS